MPHTDTFDMTPRLEELSPRSSGKKKKRRGRSGSSASSHHDFSSEKTDGKHLYTLHVKVPLWLGTSTLKDIDPDRTSVFDLKNLIELLLGVPQELQRLCYLDVSDLEDGVLLASLDIVNFATLTILFWPKWRQLFRCVAEMDIPGLLRCDITPKTPDGRAPLHQHDPNFEMLRKRRNACVYLAASRAEDKYHIQFVGKLLDLGFDVNAELDSGYRPIHTAVATGRYKCIDFLLKRGAVFDMKLKCGIQTLDVAKRYGHTQSERHLFLYEWRERAQKVRPQPQPQANELMQHQQFDSGNPTWLDGKYKTRYMCSTLPPLEFAGTGIDAKKVDKTKKRETERPKSRAPKPQRDKDTDERFEWNLKSLGLTPPPDAASVRSGLKSAMSGKSVMSARTALSSAGATATTFEFKSTKIQKARVKHERLALAAIPVIQSAPPGHQNMRLPGSIQEREDQAYITTERRVVTWDNHGHAHYDIITKRIIKYEDFGTWPDYERRILEKYFTNKIPTV